MLMLRLTRLTRRKLWRTRPRVRRRRINQQQKSNLLTRSPNYLRMNFALKQQLSWVPGVSKDTTCSPEDIQSTPLPGDTLAMFYARSREYWTQKAHGNSDNQGKQLRRDGFTLAEERYSTLFLAYYFCSLRLFLLLPFKAGYKPILAEVEKILEEAGLDEGGDETGCCGRRRFTPVCWRVVGFGRNRR
ncbi:hypothetical protein BYT27DRAFT_6768211 [Phlegmacium glaucopus]|nr:hypothetical protein BYT27DRAFT_6768211 [Phlegmacium glaucopus]